MTDAERAEAMISKWLEYNDLWASTDVPPGSYIPYDRSYVMEYQGQSMTLRSYSPVVDEVRVVTLSMALDDELNSATLLGVFEDDRLVHMTAEVDTEWREFLTSEGFTRLPG